MKMYLQEAFQAMNLLEEEDFSLTNASVKDILDFKDNDDELNILNITDPDTMEEDGLKDSYVGSVILECEVCHSPIFKNVEDVVIDEDSDLANVEDECPICHSNDGFTIIGQVAPYQEEPELDVEIEDKEASDIEPEEEIEDFDDDIVDESLKTVKKFNKLVESNNVNYVESAMELIDRLNDDQLAEFARNYGYTSYEDPNIDARYSDFEKYANDLFDGGKSGYNLYRDISNYYSANNLTESLTEASGAAALLDGGDDFGGTSTRKPRDVFNAITDCLFSHEFGYTDEDRRLNPDKAKGEHAYTEDTVVIDNDLNIVVWQPTMEDLKFAAKVARYFKLIAGVEFEGPLKERNSSMWGVARDKTTGEKIEAPYRVTYFTSYLAESLREGFEKVDLEMEDKIIHVSEEEKDPIPEAEMITPVSDELETELLADTTEDEPFDAEMEDEPMIDEPMLDEPAEDNLEVEDSTNDDDEIDYDIDDFEEDDFDELGESYLKEVYDNVNAFKTSKVSLKNEQLIVEGVIKFNSGKSKNTQFIFEAKDATKAGNVRFVGENKQISRGKKAFELRGKMQGSRFIAESLNYNYRAKNSDGKSTRLYGTVRTTKH